MIEYSLHTLENGLRVVHHRDDSTSHIALNILYNVGARDESPRLTGMAHLFEHLMFGGSVNVPDYDYALEMAGGASNAWTSNDFTNFYDIVPAENIATAFWTESDRMLRLAFTPQSLQVQRNVVMEEFKQTCLNKPYGDIGHLLRGLIYTTHPYSYPTIGRELSHIERVTMDDVKRFFFSHYAPNNAVLAVAGRISAERTFKLADKWFGPIPRRDIAPRTYSAEPEQTAPRRLEVVRDVPQTRIIIAARMDAYSHPDYRVADLITDILASGHSARFNRELVMGTDLFTAADASVSGNEEEGFIMLSGSLRSNDEATVAAGEQALLAQMRRIATEPVSDHELNRTLNRFESNAVFARLSYVAKARELAKAVMNGEDINNIISAYRSITAADISRVAARLFSPQRLCTLIYRAK
ncbi:MAG: pitrilysin family protein [Paramuribaculum sp.]